MIDKQPRHYLDMCVYSFARYSESVSPKLIEHCMKTPCWCPSEGHQYGGRKETEVSVIAFCHQNKKLLLESFDTLKLLLLVLDKELFS